MSVLPAPERGDSVEPGVGPAPEEVAAPALGEVVLPLLLAEAVGPLAVAWEEEGEQPLPCRSAVPGEGGAVAADPVAHSQSVDLGRD